VTKGFDLGRVNRFVLGKQHLTAGSRTTDILGIVRNIGGLHATGATTPYLSLLARKSAFEREDLEEELYEKKTLARIRYARNTYYILHKQMLPVAFAAARSRAQAMAARYLDSLQLTPKAYEDLARNILALLQKNGLSIGEIKSELGPIPHLSSILRVMCFLGLLMKSSLHTYHSLAQYYPDINLDQIGEEEAQEKVIGNYIEAFGPVTERDMIWWTGFTKGQVKKALLKRKGDLAQIGIAGLESRCFLFTSQLRALESSATSGHKTVSLLPCLDPYLMGYRDRERILDPDFFSYIYDRSGNATSAILCDGKITGVWDFDEPRFKYFFFPRASDDLRNSIHDQAERLGRFLSGSNPEIKECVQMLPLPQRTAGGFMSPLKDCEQTKSSEIVGRKNI